jgi:hypothetical protein
VTDVEIDQSGRIEALTVDTALALSDAIQSAVLIPSAVKRKVWNELRTRGVKAKMISLRMFAAVLYLLLEDHLEKVRTVTIDTEFPGRDSEIKGLLLNLIYQRAPYFHKEQIGFQQIGRGSPAHHIAWLTYRGEREAERKVTAAELLRLC